MSDKKMCRSDFRGDGKIPAELKEKWEEFISAECKKTSCDRRYTTRCCVWGDFYEQCPISNGQ